MKFTLTGSCRLSIKEEVMPPDSGTTSHFVFLENQQDTLWVLLETSSYFLQLSLLFGKNLTLLSYKEQ